MDNTVTLWHWPLTLYRVCIIDSSRKLIAPCRMQTSELVDKRWGREDTELFYLTREYRMIALKIDGFRFFLTIHSLLSGNAGFHCVRFSSLTACIPRWRLLASSLKGKKTWLAAMQNSKKFTDVCSLTRSCVEMLLMSTVRSKETQSNRYSVIFVTPLLGKNGVLDFFSRL